ncbi:PREDICTED: nodal modulator 1 [Polistes dominula]|uniref:Nodal modulator 1 n=1 Tax=Polistes dominula TaxID=743375 RepID=A0ABM1IGD6_POLDO|nr:PREDICTED: nodal modulator 1 [Polistes dominula]
MRIKIRLCHRDSFTLVVTIKSTMKLLKKEFNFFIFFIYFNNLFIEIITQDILGCGGFLKSHAEIDFTKVHIKLYTKGGSLKDETECAPNNGYYFLPLYDKGEYILKIDPPRGWSFDPMEVNLNVDGSTDICSQGKDINFTFKGFGITGKVTSYNSLSGPKDVTVSLYNATDRETIVRSTKTADGGTFYFTPIQPGKYILVASHPSWIIKQGTVEVTVQEGNAELPDGSLVIFGYDVKGQVTSENEPVSGVSFILFGNGAAMKCETIPVKGFESKNPLCHVTSDKSGKFIFPALSPGDYKLVPHYPSAHTKFDVQPPELLFKVNHNSLILPQDFKVTGFTVTGIVRMSTDGRPLAKAKIIFAGKEVAMTNEDGKYTVDNVKAGQYTLKAEASNVQFEERTVKVSPSSPELPVLIPLTYKVCGKVTLSAKGTLHFRKVAIQNVAGTFQKEVDANEKTGEYCLYLKPDNYKLSVIVSNEEKTKGLQFFPLEQFIAVSSESINEVNFLQLKATLIGTVQCLPGIDCSQTSVTLKVLDGVTIKTYQTKGGQYKFTDVLPGYYEVLVDNDVFCWKHNNYRISITSERFEVPPFEQTGFSITFISSHETTVEYVAPGESKKSSLVLSKGSTRHCVSKSGEYSFTPKGCHVYDKETFVWDTSNSSPIILTSTEHRHLGNIISSSALDGVKVKIESTSGNIIIGPLKYIKKGNNFKYEFEFTTKTDNVYIITPLSDMLLFNPPSVKVLGVNECHNDIATFTGDLGVIIAGKISPPLEGVTVQIFGKDKESPMHTIITKKEGTYSVGPLDGKIEYSVTAEKEGFVITESDSKGVFLARKLAEIIVQVYDQADNSSLQGVLLSLSGGQNYRKNSITSDEGKLIFNSLSPGEYYLRPMMKEYRFEPPSKMINVAEGATVVVNLFGNRVAFSAYGSVTSLNGEPEAGLLVEAQGQGDCSNLQEEATTEENGTFRIRGLQPLCTYILRLKSNVEANSHIQRTSPSSLMIQTDEDIHGLRLIAFHPISRTDISAYVISIQPEHYRTLKVKLCREDMPDSPIHISKLDTQHLNKISSSYNAGFLVHFPSLQADNKKYFIQLESSLLPSLHKYKTNPVYFEANSSFRYVKLIFSAERKVDQGDMNQTSIVALPFILLITIAFFNREKLWSWLNTLVERWSKPTPISRTSVQAIPIDPRADDIIVEQIMNINKRKTKPRKA